MDPGDGIALTFCVIFILILIVTWLSRKSLMNFIVAVLSRQQERELEQHNEDIEIGVIQRPPPAHLAPARHRSGSVS